MSGRRITITVAIGGLQLLTPPLGRAAPDHLWGESGHVQVRLDLNPRQDGFQDVLFIAPGQTRVESVAVYIYDPTGTAEIWDIGYLGGLNRGIALGHAPSDDAKGRVIDMVGRAITPVHPKNLGWVEPGYDPLFAGPEVQYVESGLESEAPAPIPKKPGDPVFVADVELADVAVGDGFAFFVGDKVSVWFEGHGAFSTQGRVTLDSGGDAVPDRTETLWGPDADVPVPVPPASFWVDYVDGYGGAVVFVVDFGDADFDGDVDLLDVAGLQAAFTGTEEVPLDQAIYDFDQDGDVDLDDYRSFHSALTGPRE